jgi:TPR repeat protein
MRTPEGRERRLPTALGEKRRFWLMIWTNNPDGPLSPTLICGKVSNGLVALAPLGPRQGVRSVMRPSPPKRPTAKRQIVGVLGLAVSLLSFSARAELADGMSAYERGAFAQAADLLTPLARQGDPRAQFMIGRMRFYGQGLAQDASAAAFWYAKAAEQGYAPAQLALGLALEGGWGVERAPEKAVHWYRRAAMQGTPSAMWRLAYHHRRGIGVQRDLAEAWAWFDRLAALGDVGAASERDWLGLVGLDEAGLLRAAERSQALGRALEQASSQRKWDP